MKKIMFLRKSYATIVTFALATVLLTTQTSQADIWSDALNKVPVAGNISFDDFKKSLLEQIRPQVDKENNYRNVWETTLNNADKMSKEELLPIGFLKFKNILGEAQDRIWQSIKQKINNVFGDALNKVHAAGKISFNDCKVLLLDQIRSKVDQENNYSDVWTTAVSEAINASKKGTVVISFDDFKKLLGFAEAKIQQLTQQKMDKVWSDALNKVPVEGNISFDAFKVLLIDKIRPQVDQANNYVNVWENAKSQAHNASKSGRKVIVFDDFKKLLGSAQEKIQQLKMDPRDRDIQNMKKDMQGMQEKMDVVMRRMDLKNALVRAVLDENLGAVKDLTPKFSDLFQAPKK